jgi:hypothetical protein
MVSLFSNSLLDQLATGNLIPIDFDDYLRLYDENEIEDELVEEEKQVPIQAENAFQAALLKNVFITNKVPSLTDTVITAISTGIVYFKNKHLQDFRFVFL